MPAATRVGDIGSGHPVAFPPSPVIAGSGNVTTNSKPASRVGDALAAHTQTVLPFETHGRSISSGSSSVTINGKPASKLGDAIGCGGSIVTGSPNVDIGG